jgi:hypothetical protein
MSQVLLIIEASRSHPDTTHSVRELWTSDQPAQIPLPDYTHKRKDIDAPAALEPAITSRRAAAEPRLRLRGHWDRRSDGFDTTS